MFEISGHDSIAVVKMNHGKVNAMDIEFCEGLSHQLDALVAEDCRAVVLTSATQVFSAGVDLLRLLDEDPGYIDPFLQALTDCFRKLFEFPKPIVAAINGHAVAGGCVLTAACDYRVIAKCLKIGVPELRVGVPFPPIALEIIRFVATQPSFQAMVNGGATYRDEQAVAVGLADSVCESSAISACALESAEQLLAIPPEVFRITKQQVRMPALTKAKQAEGELGDQILAIWNSPVMRRTIQDYVQRRL